MCEGGRRGGGRYVEGCWGFPYLKKCIVCLVSWLSGLLFAGFLVSWLLVSWFIGFRVS